MNAKTTQKKIKLRWFLNFDKPDLQESEKKEMKDKLHLTKNLLWESYFRVLDLIQLGDCEQQADKRDV